MSLGLHHRNSVYPSVAWSLQRRTYPPEAGLSEGRVELEEKESLQVVPLPKVDNNSSKVDNTPVVPLPRGWSCLQGHLAHKKTPPPRTLQ